MEIELELGVGIGIRPSIPFLRFGWLSKMKFEFQTQFHEIRFQCKSLSNNSLGVSEELEFREQDWAKIKEKFQSSIISLYLFYYIFYFYNF